MDEGRQNDPNITNENNAREQRIKRRKQFAGNIRNRHYRPHATQDH